MSEKGGKRYRMKVTQEYPEILITLVDWNSEGLKQAGPRGFRDGLTRARGYFKEYRKEFTLQATVEINIGTYAGVLVLIIGIDGEIGVSRLPMYAGEVEIIRINWEVVDPGSGEVTVQEVFHDLRAQDTEGTT